MPVPRLRLLIVVVGLSLVIGSILLCFSQERGVVVLSGLGAYSYNVPSTDPTSRGFDENAYLDAGLTSNSNVAKSTNEDDDARTVKKQVVAQRHEAHRANVMHWRREHQQKLKMKHDHFVSHGDAKFDGIGIPSNWPEPNTKMREHLHHLETKKLVVERDGSKAHPTGKKLRKEAKAEMKQWQQFSSDIFSESSNRDSDSNKNKIKEGDVDSSGAQWKAFTANLGFGDGHHHEQHQRHKLRKAPAKIDKKLKHKAESLIEQMINGKMRRDKRIHLNSTN